MSATAKIRCKMRGLLERAMELHASCPAAAPRVVTQLITEALYRIDFPETCVGLEKVEDEKAMQTLP